jgi:hypothetical protein
MMHFSTSLQRNLKHGFQCGQRIALIYRSRHTLEHVRGLNFPKLKRAAFALHSCSRKRPDRDDDSMKMRCALEIAR